ncbi:MAG TPA: DUF4325 domain-containing protein [Candidatus Paceibacterota bacterium]|nr:DUF4325 domain-containing protein [Candidatus Paceibacterota bacterium]
MNIRELIQNKISKSGQTTVSEVVKETGFSRAYVHRFFQALTDEGLIVRIGQANRAKYVLSGQENIQKAKLGILSFNRVFKAKGLQEDQVWDKVVSETGILNGVSENVRRIVEYGFTEMLNNAIEHSHSEDVKIMIDRQPGLIRFDVIDRGVGIFENIIHARHLKSAEEAIQDLLKGKQTTAPEEHSGEGIFFTRRIADTFVIRSSQKKIFFDNRKDDFTVSSIKPVSGTKVTFAIAIDSGKNLTDVFKKYTTEEYEFGTTEVTVRLYKPGQAGTFVSRSQARRVLVGLEKFKNVILDFSGVAAVGQGFVDEIFRVWKKKYSETRVTPVNANEDVEFMIRRSMLT